MQPETGFFTRYHALAGLVFLVLTAAFGVAVLIQISFSAGEASMIADEMVS